MLGKNTISLNQIANSKKSEFIKHKTKMKRYSKKHFGIKTWAGFAERPLGHWTLTQPDLVRSFVFSVKNLGFKLLLNYIKSYYKGFFNIKQSVFY